MIKILHSGVSLQTGIEEERKHVWGKGEEEELWPIKVAATAPYLRQSTSSPVHHHFLRPTLSL